MSCSSIPKAEYLCGSRGTPHSQADTPSEALSHPAFEKVFQQNVFSCCKETGTAETLPQMNQQSQHFAFNSAAGGFSRSG